MPKITTDNKNGEVRVRIAPSPTGFFHIGTARTALFNFLFAKKHNGSFILRVEDTDKKRSQKSFEKDIIDGLDWLGLKRDEGPIVGGKYGPYRQSKRTDIYKKYLKKLIREGKAFYCFSGVKSLADEKMKKKVFWSPDRDLSLKEAEEKIKAKTPYIIRFKSPPKKKIIFEDLVRQRVSFNSEVIGDFSIAKSLDEPLYNFAAVIDDYEMKISHVIRGEDHISNTPKQLLLQEALGFPPPQYAHLPLILGPDKTKLSKRHNSIALKDYQNEGYLPEAMVNFMALLGWNPGTDKEIFSIAELIENFSIKRVHSAGAVFNLSKLNWINGYYIRNLPEQRYLKLALPYFKNYKDINGDYLEKVSLVARERLKKLSDLKANTGFFFNEPNYDVALLFWKEMKKEEVKNSLNEAEKTLKKLPEVQFKEENLEVVLLKKAKEINDKDLGYFLWPVRVALTGVSASASPFEVAATLGKKESLSRIREAIKKVSNS